MKSTFAILALIGFSQAIKFDVAEGPTKADNGENDDLVLARKPDYPSAFAGSDGGDGDDTVLMDL